MHHHRAVRRPRPAPFPAHVAVPVGAGCFLAIGAIAAGLHGRLPEWGVLVTTSVVALVGSAASELGVAAGLVAIGWLTTLGFATAPYGNLTGPGRPVVLPLAVLSVAAAVGAGAGAISRGFGITLEDVITHAVPNAPQQRPSFTDLVAAVDRRRRRLGIVLGIVLLTGLTAGLDALRHDLSIADVLLIYLVAVIAVAVVGGFGPAVLAAAAASLCVNWFFTPPLHTLTIEEPKNLLALLLFVLVATSVSSVVHIAARRATIAARNAGEAQALLALARTVLGADDTPATVLSHLHDVFGIDVELQEQIGLRWSRIAASGEPDEAVSVVVAIRPGLRLVADILDGAATPALLEAAGGLAAAALDRNRLRTQASQAEALEAGNRMRTALLAAVSHDLRTPLASIKASISSLRQPDVAFEPEDEAELMGNVEESADKLDGLIANLLDMSRLQTGALQPFVQPVSVEEVAPLALHSLVPASTSTIVDIPDGLPLLRADAGLLERALANLLSNALRYSPPGRPPMLRARVGTDGVVITVIDHGPGVVASQRESMFAPFQRLGDHDTATGIGLGLAVARGFIEAMGGSIAAAETPGGGLTMIVTMAVAESHAAVDQQSRP